MTEPEPKQAEQSPEATPAPSDPATPVPAATESAQPATESAQPAAAESPQSESPATELPAAESPAAESPAAESPAEPTAPAEEIKKHRFFPKPKVTQEPVKSLEPETNPPPPTLRQMDDDIEAELEAAMGGFSQQSMFSPESSKGVQQAKAGEGGGKKKGKVLSVHGPDVFIEVPGGRSEGLLSMDQFPDGPPKVGDTVEFTIEGYDPANGLLLLSRKGAAVSGNWETLAEGMTVEARVTESNKGGLTVEVSGIRGFMPISQIDLYRVEGTEQFINQRLLSIITEIDPAEKNLVVSRRAYLEREREEQREKLWQQLAEGQVHEGVVRSVRDFGAFVDLGGADGLLHVSEMSWKRVQDPTTIVQPGQRVKVIILKIDPDTRKIGLGLKQLEASPWDNVREKYHGNQVVTGSVTKLMDFGAFVEIEPGLEGLIHISELAPKRVFRVADIVQIGQEVEVKILNIDPDQRRISLSLKAMIPVEKPKEEEPEEEEEEVVEVKPSIPRTDLRGGIGQGSGPLFKSE